MILNQKLIDCFTATVLIANSIKATLAPSDILDGDLRLAYYRGLEMAWILENYDYANVMTEKVKATGADLSQYYSAVGVTQDECEAVASDIPAHMRQIVETSEVYTLFEALQRDIDASHEALQDTINYEEPERVIIALHRPEGGEA